ncbi:MAG: hypothetical protein M1813_006977 [Trichoglossum hirsutum]|nr:MAG: hypothetical protein M1813_006977 [Trichoglossum hirsutum]
MRAEKEDKERKKKERKEKEKEKGIEESVAAPKKDRSLLPAGYAASAVPVRTGSADPCLRCVKQLDKTPGSGCPKIPHAACLRCSKAKVKCEEVILCPQRDWSSRLQENSRPSDVFIIDMDARGVKMVLLPGVD